MQVKISKTFWGLPRRLYLSQNRRVCLYCSFDMLRDCLECKIRVCCWGAKGMGVKGATAQRLIVAPGLVQAVHLWVATVVLGFQGR